MLVLVRTGVLAGARPLLVSSRDHDGGEVVRLSSAVRLRQEGGVMANPGLIIWPSLLSLVRPQLFALSLADVFWATWPSD